MYPRGKREKGNVLGLMIHAFSEDVSQRLCISTENSIERKEGKKTKKGEVEKKEEGKKR